MLSCNKTEDKLILLNKQIRKINPSLLTFDRIIIIPGEGCGGCISSATSYIISEEIPQDLRIHTVFTNVGDYKLFRNQIGYQLNPEDYSLDSSNYLRLDKISSIYPQLIIIEKGKIIGAIDFDPIANPTLKNPLN